MWLSTATLFSLSLLNTVSSTFRYDVKFYLSTREQNRTEINNDNLNIVDIRKPTSLLIHGFTMNSSIPWIIDLTEALLEKSDCNVIAVDYADTFEPDIFSLVNNSRAVGYRVGDLIVNLYTNYSANLSNFQVIGHSLGGQISGFVAKTVQNLTGLNISKIIGLDPAGPLFFQSDPKNRLASTDADIVVVIHTDGLVFGYYYQVGGIDFYANGGTAPQPGCLSEDFQWFRCSHLRATSYYLEAVRNPNGFVATQCSDYLSYKFGSCKENNTINLGKNYTQSDFGKYYFNTNSNSPYSEE